MIDALATALIVASLALAAWSLVSTVRNRPIDLSHLIGAALVEVLMLVQAAAALLPIADGRGPEQLATFMAYLVVSVATVPVGVLLARMERTRWSSAIMLAACLVLPILVIRLQQVWGATSG